MPVVGPPMGSAQPMGYYPGPPQPSPAVYHGGPPPNMGYGPGGGGNGAPPPPQVSDHVENAKKRHDYEALCHIINQWNANRLDLFALSLPNEVGTQFFVFISFLLKSWWIEGAIQDFLGFKVHTCNFCFLTCTNIGMYKD